MAVTRAQRQAERRPAVEARFGPEGVRPALELLELLERAWHDSYGEITPSPQIVDDILLLSDGRLDRLVHAGLRAVVDWRDVRVWADERRGARGTGPTTP